MNPLVSVLIPVYQVEAYLPRCLDSLLAQTYRPLEVLMVDDGSTDQSVAAAQPYLQQAAVPMSLELSPHQGVSHSRQRLVERAQGEYCFFLDSDDYLDPQTIEVLVRTAQQKGADMVQCKMERTQENALPPVDCSSPDIQVYSGKVPCMAAYLGAFSPLRCMLAAKLYRRGLLSGIPFPIGKIHEDEATMHRIISRAQRVACVGLPLYHYFTNPASIMKRRFTYARYDILDAIRDRIEYSYSQGCYFLAKLGCLHYITACANMIRQTIQEIDPQDPHIPWLRERYKAMAAYFLSTGIPKPGLQDRIRRQLQDPIPDHIGNYFDTARQYYEERMSRMKKISIIIPVYNNPKELRLTLRSIANADFPLNDLEVLVCDDGSSLGMKAAAEEYGDKLTIRYFWQEDKGFRPGTARNMGIRAAQGQLCLFLDSGVILTTGCLREHWRLYQQHGPKLVALGYIYGNDIVSDLDEMRQIIDTHTPDEAADLMAQRHMVDGRERDYAQCGDDLSRWPAPWMELWSLHFSVPTSFMREEGVYFDDFFCTWGCEDNDFGIQAHSKGALFVLARGAKALHYPAKVRSYDRLHNDPDFRAGWLKNKEYLKQKWPNHQLVQLWLEKGGKAIKDLPLLAPQEANP